MMTRYEFNVLVTQIIGLIIQLIVIGGIALLFINIAPPVAKFIAGIISHIFTDLAEYSREGWK